MEVNLPEALKRPEMSTDCACSATLQTQCHAIPIAPHNGFCCYSMTAHAQLTIIQCHLYHTLSQLRPQHMSSCRLACENMATDGCSQVPMPELDASSAVCFLGPPWGQHIAAVGHNYIGCGCAKKKPKVGAWMILPVRNASSTVGQLSMISSFPFAEYTLMFCTGLVDCTRPEVRLAAATLAAMSCSAGF